MSDFQNFVKVLSTLLCLEIREHILFYVGEVFLYFDYSKWSNTRLLTLITKNDGAGFVLEEAIKRAHKPLIQWLLKSFDLPKEYLLVSAISYGDLFTLSHIVSLIGEDYKEHDTEAKLLCITEGKVQLLEYLYERNKFFSCDSKPVRESIIKGLYTSRELCAWYLKNKTVCPPISKEILFQAYLENGDMTRIIEHLDNENVKPLLEALSTIKSGKEETFRWLIVTYSDEEHVLTYVAKACTTLGYVDTLEELFKEPYNVPIEYDMFAGMESLAVAKILHKYAYQRDSISKLLSQGHTKKLKSRFTTYRNRKSYLHILKIFRQSARCFRDHSEAYSKKEPSEEVLLFLVDLADITSNTKQVKQYIVYAIEHGLLKLLKVLLPYLRVTDVNRLPGLDIYRSYNEEMIEYILELGITQTTHMEPLPYKFSLQFIHNLIQRGLVLNDDGGLVEWNSETEKALQKEMTMKFHINSDQQLARKETYIALIRRFYADVSLFTYPRVFGWYLLSEPRTPSFSNILISTVEAQLQTMNMYLLCVELQNSGH
ncbi:hypothetical protein K7432_004748 [Basidiobolus ranarum]|uniref:Uncharacterized protein n=1 Tax=Basidiobolus ranarum TaxID=34480 RepID=A0ABR2WXM4_9FUNG